jgi:hypothetical protein
MAGTTPDAVGVGAAARGRRSELSVRMLVLAAVLAAAAAALLYAGLGGGSGTSAPASARRTLRPQAAGASLSLPLAARGPASAAIGARTPGYRANSAHGAISANNPAEGLHASFSTAGVAVSSGTAHVRLLTRAEGYGSTLRTLRGATPRASANRVTYARTGLTEWYANGPFGLEQGFTVAHAPTGPAAGPLTVAMALTGDAQPVLAHGARSVLFRVHGRTVLSYGALSATDASGRALRAWMQLQNGRLLLRVDVAGAKYPVRIDPLLQNGSEFEAEGEFGYTVAMSEDGTTAIVGAPTGALGEGHGNVTVFHLSGATWSQQAKLSNPGAGANEFGRSVAISADGNTAIVGAPNAGPEPEVGPSGVAYMFTRSGSTWSGATSIFCNLATEEEACVHFGQHVAISGDGDTALIGNEPRVVATGANDTWAFSRSGEAWSQQGGRLREGEETVPQGLALSNDGNTALIAGHFFTRSEGNWTEQANEGEAGGGMALSSDGNTAVVGENGGVRFFVRAEGAWSQQGEVTGAGELGHSASLSADGNAALVGAPGLHEARVYARSEGSWSLRERLEPKVASASQAAGSSVALAGNASTAVVGGPAPGELESNPGGAWFFGEEVGEPTGPTATTEAATAVSTTSATLNASVDPNGVEVTECEFQYSEREGYEFAGEVPCSPEPGSGSSPVAVSATVKGLHEATAYHFRIVVKSKKHATVFGSSETFTTLVAPTVVTGAATAVTKTGATLNATVNPHGSLVSSCKFEYGTTQAYGSTATCSPAPGSGTSPVAVSAAVSGLTAFTTYHYRIVATNGGGTADGADESFRTLPSAPEVTFAQADGLRPAKVTLKAGVKPNGSTVTDCHFEYGTTESFGASVPCTPSPGSGETSVTVSGAVSGLSPGTKYYTRVVATNAGGTTQSGITPFKTPVLIPELGRCVKVTAKGNFSNSVCTSELPASGKYEWVPGPGPSTTVSLPVKAGTKVILEDAKKHKITCAGGSGGGELTGDQTVSGINLTLTGCEDATKPCQSVGLASGEVVLAGLTGELGVIKYGASNKEDKVGLSVSGESSFECAGGMIAVTIGGTAISSLSPADSMLTSRVLKFAQSKGLEKPEAFEEAAVPPQLEWAMTGFASPVRVGLSLTGSFVTAEKIEINTVI